MKKIVIALCALLSWGTLRADEGMWLLPFLQKLNMRDMKAAGLKLSAQEIYNLNGNSLKDAVVIFGGGCTGEIVSAEGLVFTNHHCGYGAIQRLSSVENDYLQEGFWAMNRAEELPCPGMSVTFVRSIEEVTDQVLASVQLDGSGVQYNQQVSAACDSIVHIRTQQGSSRTFQIKSFFGGNQFLLFELESYRDVRLVGAPPASIGKFGGETDNWMWPRHTGDISIFRVYADKKGKPAAYSKENQPLQTANHLKISLKGAHPGAYAMTIGFPGSTERYMTSYEIDQLLRVDNPNRIFIRGERQRLMMEDMRSSEKIRLQYANKYAGSANYWKNSIGESRGLLKLGVKAQKEAQEERFRAWVAQDPVRMKKYGSALDSIHIAVQQRLPIVNYYLYLSEALMRGTDILSIASSVVDPLLKADSTRIDSALLERMKRGIAGLYKDFNPSTERKIGVRMIELVYDSLQADEQPDEFMAIKRDFNGDPRRYATWLYDRSVFSNQERLESFLEHPSLDSLRNDPAYRLLLSVRKRYAQGGAQLMKLNAGCAWGYRLYIAGLMEMQPEKTFYPDANFTMRLSYGKVLPYRPADGVIYDYYTTLDGVIAKEDTTNAMEFSVPEKLKTLYQMKDYGSYGEEGKLRVCFLTNNDITGGNSGSPVLNAKGELIGLAFDGNWEAMSGDIAFEPDLQRTIAVDIRYVLFLIDKFAGATYLIQELDLVR